MSITASQVKSGMAWIAGISLLRDGLQFGTTLVLVRVLDHRAYGEYSLVGAVLGLLTVISFHSFLEYTIQARPGETVDYQAQFTFGGLAQLAAVLALNGVALAFGRFPAYAPVVPVLRVMSLAFVVDWAGELRVRMLERELNWSRLRSLEAIGLVGSAAVSLALAFRGAGVYALLLPTAVATLPFIYDLFFLLRWRPTWELDWRAFRPAWHYGLTRIASGLAARGQQVLESGFLAGALGLATLGEYGRAVGLASFCCLKLTSVLTLTLFPMVTRLEPDSGEFERASGLVLRAVAWTSIPAAAILSVLASPLVRTLYGDRWLATIRLLPWALAIMALTAVMEAAAFLLLAKRHPRKTLALDLWNLAGTAACLVFLLPWGITVYMAGLVVAQALLMAVAIAWLHSCGALDRQAILTSFGVPLGAWAVLLVCGRLISPSSLPQAIGFGLGCATTYGITLFALCRVAFLELLRYVPGSRSL